MKAAVSLLFLLAFAINLSEAKRQYQPSEKVLNQMMEIELERYQHQFSHVPKRKTEETDAEDDPKLLGLSQDQDTQKEKSILEVYLPSIPLKLIEGPITTTYVAVWVLIYGILIAILYRVMKHSKKNQEAAKQKSIEEYAQNPSSSKVENVFNSAVEEFYSELAEKL